MAKTWFNITKKPSNQSVLIIDIFDPIGYWGVSAQQFIMQLRAAGPVPEIELNIDCPGGDCEEGFTIFDALKNSGAKITAHIIGTAASMASVIMCAASKILIAENGRVMIHRVTAGVDGNADDIAAAAAITKQFEDRIVGIYVTRTGKTEAEIRDLMKSELGTWFFGQQAIDAGFCDALISGQKAAAFKNTWASLFTVLPAALFDTSSQASPPRTISTIPMKALLALASTLGITVPDGATEEQAIAAFAAYKPKDKNVVIDFEDAAVKSAFEKAVASHTQPLTDKIAAVEAENKRLIGLITNGAAGSAGSGSPIENSKKEEDLTIHEQYNAITNSDERAKFYAKHKKELIGE